jgi:hypothetical protein
MALDEADRRREDIATELCCPVRLGDGQEWLIRTPAATIRPVFQDGELVRCWQDLSYDDGLIDGLLERISAADNTAEVLLLSLALAALVVRLSYELDDDELNELLQLRPDDPDSVRVLEDVVAVASGRRRPGADLGD